VIEHQFNYLETLKKNLNLTWQDVSDQFNSQFGTKLTAEAVRKKYRRENEKRELINGDIVEKAIRIIKHEPIKPTELAKRLKLDIDGLESLLDDFQNSRAAVKFHENYLIWDKLSGIAENQSTYFSSMTDNKGWVKYGVVADTHICSIHERLDLLVELYDIFEEEGVTAVFHGGDVTSGNGTVYKGQFQELKIFGAENQKNYVCSVYPEKNFPTYWIAGNHDEDLYKTAGVDILANISREREDLIYAGKLGAYLISDGLSVYIHHGEGGIPYSRDFKSQKLIDGLEKLPQIAVIGHWHTFAYLPCYKGVTVVLPGCLEGQSSYLKRKGHTPDLGGAIISVKIVDKDGRKYIERQTADFIHFSNIKGY
jgi:predicted phosphodiesterase